MCGILGYIARENIRDTQEKFINSLGMLSHRGPDFQDFIQYENILLGHTRLAILDLDSRSNQPMNFGDKYTLIFNGEIYNYKELREELSIQGYRFHTQSDTEVLVCAYDYWGEKCVEYFNGMWAFALLDKEKNIIFCSRDRFGEKPFFYFQDEDRFIFASEIKAILPFLKSVKANISAMIPFIVRGNVDCCDNETFFKGVYRLNPAENMVISFKTLEIRKTYYYHLGAIAPKAENPYKNVRMLLEDSVRLRLRSDVRIGGCLSGGLDSSCLNALIAKFHPNKKDYIAIHAKSSLQESDESWYAEEVAKYLGIELCVIEPTEDEFLDSLEKVMQTQDEPFGSTSIYMQYFVMQKARKLGIKVMFDGQGADEVFLGYEGYLKNIYKYFNDKGEEKNFFENLKMFRYSKEGILDGFCGINDYNIMFERIQKSNIKNKYLKKEEIKQIFHYETFLGFNVKEIKSNNLQALLRYEDRDSMAFGVETRLPYLDHRLVDFVLSLPVEIKFQQGYLKYLLRKSCEDLLPKQIVWRYNKMGFESPQKEWLKTFKREMLMAINHSRILKEIFDKIEIREDNFMWRLYNIAKWEEIYRVEI
ncbi:asparagine synthase (glutamine-hydrolyzing) [Helicobacter pullorum]|uniref:asparagine synthase (glutamine-hydrolyzing) n=1 Tax=Helicobacter pullorum TaxID=35818 RepID=UPI001E16CED0|nr:asparagine synthase (glutamine-hydrolyzing) [Helicobacter pullorum]HJF83580.1 asparagine synthase (glutamine-hydrolyzing) [Helicobacter pullorum]